MNVSLCKELMKGRIWCALGMILIGSWICEKQNSSYSLILTVLEHSLFGLVISKSCYLSRILCNVCCTYCMRCCNAKRIVTCWHGRDGVFQERQSWFCPRKVQEDWKPSLEILMEQELLYILRQSILSLPLNGLHGVPASKHEGFC